MPEQDKREYNLMSSVYGRLPAMAVISCILIAIATVSIIAVDNIRGTTDTIKGTASDQFSLASFKADSSLHMKQVVELCILKQQPLYIDVSPISDRTLHFKDYGDKEINKEATNVVNYCLKKYVEGGLSIDDYESRAVAVKALRPHMIT